jgi:ribose/xylose/arabinose/galactoside ABC-type transport system permease subunit
MTIIGTISIGMTFVILSGGIDLSVGSLVALVSIISMSIQNYGVVTMIIAGITVGITVGLTNGLLITIGKVAPFIATLSMMTIAHGLALWYSGQQIIHGQNLFFEFIGNGWLNMKIIKIPVPVVIFSIFFAVSYFLLNNTKFGKYVKAIGGNREATRLSGVNISFYLVITYVFCSFMTSIAGLIVTSRMNTGSPVVGQYYELDAIACVIIGGTSLFGGRGSLIGTLFGVMILGLIANIMTLQDLPSYVQYVIRGVIIITAVILQRGGVE